jgi:hypothetical protein
MAAALFNEKVGTIENPLEESPIEPEKVEVFFIVLSFA